MFVFAVTTAGAPFDTDSGAFETAVAVVVAVRSSESGSVVDVVTCAVLVMAVPFGVSGSRRAVSENVAESPGLIEGVLHVNGFGVHVLNAVPVVWIDET